MKNSVRVGAVCFQEYPGDYYEFLDLAQELGLSWVELKFEPPICLRPGSLKYREIKQKAVDLGIGLSLHTPFIDLNIASINEKERQYSLLRIKESLDAAEQLGISHATVHGGYLRSEDYSDTSWDISKDLNIKSLAELVLYGKSRGITLCLENGNAFKRNFLKQGLHPGEMKQIQESVGSDLKFTIDFGHAMYFSLDPSFIVPELGLENVKLSHIHSNFQLADTHDPLGVGYLKLDNILDSYAIGEWNFPLSIEMKSEEGLRESVAVIDSHLFDRGYKKYGYI